MTENKTFWRVLKTMGVIFATVMGAHDSIGSMAFWFGVYAAAEYKEASL